MLLERYYPSAVTAGPAAAAFLVAALFSILVSLVGFTTLTTVLLLPGVAFAAFAAVRISKGPGPASMAGFSKGRGGAQLPKRHKSVR